MAVVALGLALGWRGVDWPAQMYRVTLVHRHGLTLWDSQWFSGHWLGDYSILVAPVAAVVGLGVLAAVSAAVAAACFARLVAGLPGARAAAVVFALGLAVPVAIGQITFLAGAAVALVSLVLAARHRWVPAGVAAVATSLTSPLDGAFLGLAATAAALAWRHRPATAWRAPVALAIAALVPVGVLALAFPGDGTMPYPVIDWVWELSVAAGAWILVGRDRPELRWGAALYAAALTFAEVVPSALGGNIGRLEDLAAVPLAVAVLWRHRLVLVVLLVPLVLSQWSPATAAMTTYRSAAWTHRPYFAPLVAWVAHAGGPAGRVEVVPTAAHYEATYVSPTLALARGWERQLDEADNPIFYRPGALDDATYRAWLLANGVRWVALPSAPLDSAGQAEGRLVAAGVPGLVAVWSDADWRVWAVTGSDGLAPAGCTVVESDGPRLVVRASRPGPVVVRVRWTPSWQVESGGATLREAPGGWLLLEVARPGLIVARVGWPRP